MKKQHSKNEFYVKSIRGGYYGVYDGYDKSLASLEITKENADKVCEELNNIRNKRFGF